MLLKLFDRKKDRKHLVEWCRKRDWPEIGDDLLSDYGFLAYTENKHLAACWMYPVKGSNVCWMAFPIANPDTTKEERKEALDLVFETIHDTAKEMGYKYVFTTSNTPPIEDRLKNYGYRTGDENVTQYWGKL